MSTVFSPLQNKNSESISVGIQEITFNGNCAAGIHNDISAMDKGKVTVLTLLDLSSAFDTIHHSIVLG